VKLFGGSLASASDLNVLGGANAGTVRRGDGAWEVIQFANASLVADRTYELSRLLRGQAGSEWAMANPLPAGAPFVLLDEHVVTVARGLDTLERQLRLRIVAASRDHGDASAVEMIATPQATAAKPLSPVHVAAQRMPEGIAISWIRRTRRDGDTWAGEVPLGEDGEAYAIDILSGSTVLRTLNANTPGVTYASADELTDFGSVQSSLSLRVSQLSSTVGRGFPLEATLAV
jgi:hypothetical protein